MSFEVLRGIGEHQRGNASERDALRLRLPRSLVLDRRILYVVGELSKRSIKV